MDVNMISKLSQQQMAVGSSAGTAKSSQTKADAESSSKTTTVGNAYDVDISDAAKKASSAIKGLSADQIGVLKDGIAKSQQLMIETLTNQNVKLQGWLDKGVGKLNFSGVLIGTDKFALPAVGTTPEEAAKAVADGGDYSVDSVATRIMDMATAIAGGDEEKLRTMQAAVEKGFSQAGVAWKSSMGTDKMPQITQDTHDEVTRRFDELYKSFKKTDSTDTTL